MFYLYKITVNDKIYIGQTIDPSKRWNRHKTDKRMVIGKAIAKYGKENAKFDVIAMCKTQSEANYTEMELIKQYNSMIPCGYNADKGGRENYSELLRIKLSKAQTGKKRTLTEEHKKNIGKASSGQNNGMFGKNHSDESKYKISKTHKGRPHSKEHKRKIGEARKGIAHSEKTKQKLSEYHWSLTIIQAEEAKNLYEQGVSLDILAKKFGISRSSVYRNIKRIR